MARKALARKITRKQARSYQILTPNPMGVTAIAAVNKSRRSYKKRYAATKKLLAAKPRRRVPGRSVASTWPKTSRRRASALRNASSGLSKRRRAPARRVTSARGKPRALTLKEWEAMFAVPNRKKRRQSKKARAASIRNLKKAHAAAKRKFKFNPRRRTLARRRSRFLLNPFLQAAGNRRKRHVKRHVRRHLRNPIMQAAGNRRRRHVKRHRRNPFLQAAANKRKRHVKRHVRRRVHRNPFLQAAANKRKRHVRRHVRRRAYPRFFMSNPWSYSDNKRKHRSARRRYRRNSEKYTFKKALGVGLAVTGGFIAHRAVTSAVFNYVIKDKLGKWGALASSALVAAVGVPALWFLKGIPEPVRQAGTGMLVSVLHKAVVDVLLAVNQPNVAGYLAAYPDASGPAYDGFGSYYEYTPGQQYSGLGGPPAPPLLQAAGGMGEYYQLQGTNAMGEYFMPEPMGIGEYEEVAPEPSALTAIDEGIGPTADEAERALTIVEAAAGLGGGPAGVSMVQTSEPTDYASSVEEAPTGSRSGIFAGGGGIFG